MFSTRIFISHLLAVMALRYFNFQEGRRVAPFDFANSTSNAAHVLWPLFSFFFNTSSTILARARFLSPRYANKLCATVYKGLNAKK
jgi:hypothetical protein